MSTQAHEADKRTTRTMSALSTCPPCEFASAAVGAAKRTSGHLSKGFVRLSASECTRIGSSLWGYVEGALSPSIFRFSEFSDSTRFLFFLIEASDR
jgi:hypothetical protein